MVPETRSRRVLIGLGIYAATVLVYALVAHGRLSTHTPGNHYALMADAWLRGRLDLGGPPPSYTGGNDFALYGGRWFISFPPFPAVLMLPLVWASGSAENFRDGQFIVWLAGVGPAVLFLVLEALRRTGRAPRTEVENVRLALLFAFGTVYFFTAVHGMVWYAAHVVGVGLAALFVLFALDARRPALAGAMLGCMFLTRPTTALVGVLFALEAIRVSYTEPSAGPTRQLPAEGDLVARAVAVARGLDRAKLARLLVAFALPVGVALCFASWLNHARFDSWSPSAFGHEHLQIGWRGRIDRWGLFSTHFLPRNLAVMLASLPWRTGPADRLPVEALGMTFHAPRYVISGHGLALWFTTPFYLWLLRPSRAGYLWCAAGLAALGPLVMNLLYQNSGWYQFAYRFSNDYAILLFVMLAVSVRRLRTAFWAAAAWAIAWSLVGAITFDHEWNDRPKFHGFYSHDTAVLPPD